MVLPHSAQIMDGSSSCTKRLNEMLEEMLNALQRSSLGTTWSFIHANFTVISLLLHAEPYLGRAGMWLLQRKDAGGGSARASQEITHFEVHN